MWIFICQDSSLLKYIADGSLLVASCDLSAFQRSNHLLLFAWKHNLCFLWRGFQTPGCTVPCWSRKLSCVQRHGEVAWLSVNVKEMLSMLSSFQRGGHQLYYQSFNVLSLFRLFYLNKCNELKPSSKQTIISSSFKDFHWLIRFNDSMKNSLQGQLVTIISILIHVFRFQISMSFAIKTTIPELLIQYALNGTSNWVLSTFFGGGMKVAEPGSYQIHSLKLTFVPENRLFAPKGNNHLPSINFQKLRCC